MCHHHYPLVKREEGEEQDTPMDTPAINDNFWRIDFLIVQVHRMTFLDDILGSDLCSAALSFSFKSPARPGITDRISAQQTSS